MARARLLKPGFFKNEELAKLSYVHRLTFAGLWTLADRAGRLEDRPERIKAELFPYEDVDVDRILADLAARDFIQRYTYAAKVSEESVGIKTRRKKFDLAIAIPTFLDHQTPHHREPPSRIPAPTSRRSRVVSEARPEASLGLDRGGEKPKASLSDPVTGDPVTGDPVPRATGNGDRPVNARSRHPIFAGERIVVFDWMLEDLGRLLGGHLETFHIDEWFYELDRQTKTKNVVLPYRDKGAYVIEATLAEAQRRGLRVSDGHVQAPTIARPRNCKHEPPCASDLAHTDRYRAEINQKKSDSQKAS